MNDTRVQKIPTAVAKPRNELKVSDINITDEFMVVDENATGRIVGETLLKIPGGGVVLVKAAGAEINILGVISVRDVLVSIARGENAATVKATNLMSTKLMKVHIETNLLSLVPEIQQKQPHAIIVVDDGGSFMGFFSPNDHRVALEAARG